MKLFWINKKKKKICACLYMLWLWLNVIYIPRTSGIEREFAHRDKGMLTSQRRKMERHISMGLWHPKRMQIGEVLLVFSLKTNRE